MPDLNTNVSTVMAKTPDQLRHEAASLVRKMQNMQIQTNPVDSSTVTTTEATGKVEFNNLLNTAISKVNELQHVSSDTKKAYITGDKDVSIGQVVLQSQQASLAFKGLLKTRNEIISAYKEIMNMPI